MNRIYKTIRSAVRDCAVAVSELTSSAGVGGGVTHCNTSNIARSSNYKPAALEMAAAGFILCACLLASYSCAAASPTKIANLGSAQIGYDYDLNQWHLWKSSAAPDTWSLYMSELPVTDAMSLYLSTSTSGDWSSPADGILCIAASGGTGSLVNDAANMVLSIGASNSGSGDISRQAIQVIATGEGSVGTILNSDGALFQIFGTSGNSTGMEYAIGKIAEDGGTGRIINSASCEMNISRRTTYSAPIGLMSDAGSTAVILNSGSGKLNIEDNTIAATGLGNNSIQNTGSGKMTVGMLSNIQNLTYVGSATGTQTITGTQTVVGGGNLVFDGPGEFTFSQTENSEGKYGIQLDNGSLTNNAFLNVAPYYYSASASALTIAEGSRAINNGTIEINVSTNGSGRAIAARDNLSN